MKLKEIIKAIRRNTINDLIGEELNGIDFQKIVIYAEHSVSTDTNYIFFKSKRELNEIIKYDDLTYERLCSLEELEFLIDHYLSQYHRKPDDILVIDIIDHLDNANF